MAVASDFGVNSVVPSQPPFSMVQATLKNTGLTGDLMLRLYELIDGGYTQHMGSPGRRRRSAALRM